MRRLNVRSIIIKLNADIFDKLESTSIVRNQLSYPLNWKLDPLIVYNLVFSKIK